MRFGQKIRTLRQEMELSQRDLATLVGVTFTYISKIENQKLDFGDFPSEEMVCKLADALKADEDEFLVLSQKIPRRIRQRILERPEAFGRIAQLDDKQLDHLLKHIAKGSVRPRQGTGNKPR